MAQDRQSTTRGQDSVVVFGQTTMSTSGTTRIEFATEPVDLSLGDVVYLEEENTNKKPKNVGLNKNSDQKTTRSAKDVKKKKNQVPTDAHGETRSLSAVSSLDPKKAPLKEDSRFCLNKGSKNGPPPIMLRQANVMELCKNGVGLGCRPELQPEMLAEDEVIEKSEQEATTAAALKAAQKNVQEIKTKRRRRGWAVFLVVIVLATVGVFLLVHFMSLSDVSTTPELETESLSLYEILSRENYTMMYTLEDDPVLENIKVRKAGEVYAIQVPSLPYELVFVDGALYQVEHATRTFALASDDALDRYLPVRPENLGNKLADGEETIYGTLYRTEKYAGATAFFEVNTLKYIRVGNSELYEIWQFEPTMDGSLDFWRSSYKFREQRSEMDETQEATASSHRVTDEATPLRPGEFRILSN